jgi:hypothetical protein
MQKTWQQQEMEITDSWWIPKSSSKAKIT